MVSPQCQPYLSPMFSRSFFSFSPQYHLFFFNFNSLYPPSMFSPTLILQVLPPICCPPQPSQSLCSFSSHAQFSDGHLSMSVRLPSLNLFPCHSLKSRTPRCFIPRWAQGETSKGVQQPPDPSSVICKGKSTLLIGGEASKGWRAGMEVVILALGGSEVKRGRSHR